jgi:hypothetical protein
MQQANGLKIDAMVQPFGCGPRGLLRMLGLV